MWAILYNRKESKRIDRMARNTREHERIHRCSNKTGKNLEESERNRENPGKSIKIHKIQNNVRESG